jgi:Zn-dependent protease
VDLIWQLLIFFFAVVIHEYAHGLVASLRGDRTAQYAGRLTLNPLAHIDPLGTILLPILLLATRSPVIFGWAKPVPINYWGLKNPKRDIVLVGLAGPLANICLAFALSLILKFSAALPLFAVFLIYQAIVVNIVLAVFNLMPIPPLDGSRVAIGLLPSSAARQYAAIEPYGFIILLILLYLRLFDYIIWPIVNIVLRLLNMPIP